MTKQKGLRRIVHESLMKADDDYGRRLNFNTVVSTVMSLMNHVAKFDDNSAQGRAVVQEALSAALLMMAPITPHICHQLWANLTGTALESAEWMGVDESALEKTSVELIVQVNGKLRGKFESPVDAPQEGVELIAKQDDNVSRFLEGKNVRKIIYVKNKLINFVVS